MEFLKANARRLVIKIGTHSISGPNGEVDRHRIADLARQIAAVRQTGLEVMVVSSGAVGMGLRDLGHPARPTELADLQACAAVGQSHLMEAWRAGLAQHGITAAQILLTREDIRGRRRHLAVRSTLECLLARHVVPVANENDTVSADEIKFGDNDVLSALLASLLNADLLVILSTIPGLLTDKGRGQLIPVVEQIDERITAMAGDTTDARATGGMISKIEAARLATRSGCGVFIGSASAPDILPQIANGSATGTFFLPRTASLAARKRWIAFFEKPRGTLYLDEGARHAVSQQEASLLAKGILRLQGSFPARAVVQLADARGNPFARGIASFSSDEIPRILGMDSCEIHRQFPRRRSEVVHRDSLVLL